MYHLCTYRLDDESHPALWSLTAAEEWMKLGRATFAAADLQQSQDLYAELRHNEDAMSGFKEMSAFMHDLSLTVRMKLGQARKRGVSGASATGHLVEPDYGRGGGDPLGVTNEDVEEEEEEQMETLDMKPTAGHRKGMSITTAGLGDAHGALSPIASRTRSVVDDPLAVENGRVIDDEFE